MFDLRRCRVCERDLPDSEFHRRRTRTPDRICKACAKKATMDRLSPRQEAIRAIKMESGCVRCGWRGHWAALDFDHGEGYKDSVADSISKMVTKTTIPLDELVAAAKRCTVLCSNCHRVMTHVRKQRRPPRSRIADDEVYQARRYPSNQLNFTK